jgi:hypothetical protein
MFSHHAFKHDAKVKESLPFGRIQFERSEKIIRIDRDASKHSLHAH